MKICFVLQRRFVYLGHLIALNLKESYGFENFCVFSFLRPGYEFLKSQTQIKYSSVLLDEDIHREYKKEKLDLSYLNWLEKEYGLPSLWSYIEVDRILRFNQLRREYPHDKPIYTHEELMLMVQTRAKAIINFFDQEKPDYIVFSVIGSLSALLLYRIAQKKGIKPLFISTTRVNTNYLLTDDVAYFTDVDRNFKAVMTNKRKAARYNDAKKILDEFREKPKAYESFSEVSLSHNTKLGHLGFLKPTKLFKNFVWVYQSLNRYSWLEKTDYSSVNPWDQLKDKFWRKIRVLFRPISLYDQPDFNEDFAFYALHLDPELATMLYAPFYTDQLYLIKQIAHSLPLSYKLYVKEHPSMVEYRSNSFYRELKKIPNVKLIHPKTSAYQIMPKAKLVLTITGTVGWEALWLGKPVITFGDVFYNSLSMVRQCHDITQLPVIIRQQLDSFDFDDNELTNFVACILENSVESDILTPWQEGVDINKAKSVVVPIADLLAEKLNLAKL